jgi:hypothetical protein
MTGHQTNTTAQDRLQIVSDCYSAYATGDRSLIAPHLAEDFQFYSPPDPGIGLDAYWERCWPGAAGIAGFSFVRLVELPDDEVLVTYEATRTDGTRFRNTEVMAFNAAGQVRRVEVYFGWDLT